MTEVSGGYEFELQIGVPGGEPDQSVTGLISTAGQIRERSRVARPGGCPICLPAGTRIATPGGRVPVEQIAPGDVVWTVDVAGSRVAAPVAQVVRRGTAGPHLLLRLSLADGRVLVAAGAHPAVDGMYLRQLRRGQTYDSAMIVSVGWVPSGVPATFDILPAGPTGTYWADGIPVGSTPKPLGYQEFYFGRAGSFGRPGFDRRRPAGSSRQIPALCAFAASVAGGCESLPSLTGPCQA